MKNSVNILLCLALTISGLSFYACQEDDFVANNQMTTIEIQQSTTRGEDGLYCNVSTTAAGQVDSLINVLATEGSYPRESITHLTVSGPINSTDIGIMCNFQYLDSLILSDALIGEIPYRSFSSFKSKAHIMLPNSLKKISEWGFGSYYGRSGCKAKSLYIPDSVGTIGYNAFYYNEFLESVRLPKNLAIIEKEVFSECWNLKGIEIPESVRKIGECAFYNCVTFDTIRIPDRVSTIGERVFYGCSNLKKVVWPKYCYEIPDRAFIGCSSLKFDIPKTIKTIGYSAFENCTSITEYNIPESVTSIGTGAFIGTGITSLVITSKTLLNSSMFRNCPITSLTIEEGVTSLSSYIFEGCNELESVKLPSSMKKIDASAFYRCQKLENVVMSEGIETIGESAFRETSIKEITFPSTLKTIDNIAFYKTPIIKAKFPNSLKSIGVQAFDECKSLAEIELNEGLESIGNMAFRVTGLKSIVTPSTLKTLGEQSFMDVLSLQSVTLNDGLTSIGRYCFRGTSIQTITVPSTVTACGDQLFHNCQQLTSVYWQTEFQAPDLFSDDEYRNILLYLSPGCSSTNTNLNQIVNGKSQSTILLRNQGNFHCPESFETDIKYERVFNYQSDNIYSYYEFQNKIGNASCWQTIVLPFDVASIKCGDKELVPFGAEKEGAYPFWLRELTPNGFVRATKIEANKPYIIAMPNNSAYDEVYNIKGTVTFSADDVTIPKTEELKEVKGKSFNFYPTYMGFGKDAEKLVVNRVNEFHDYNSNKYYYYGSVFVASTYDCLPFNAYVSSPADGRSIIPIETTFSSRKAHKLGPIPQEDDM